MPVGPAARVRVAKRAHAGGGGKLGTQRRPVGQGLEERDRVGDRPRGRGGRRVGRVSPSTRHRPRRRRVKRLKLVAVLVHHVPEPGRREAHVERGGERDAKEVFVIRPRGGPVPKAGAQRRVHVPEAQLGVEHEEDGVAVDKGRDRGRGGPRRAAEQALREAGEGDVHHGVNLGHIALAGDGGRGEGG